MNKRGIQGGCIAAAFFMVAALFFGAHEIGRVNLVPHVFHKVEYFFYYGATAFLLAYGLGRRWFWIALLAVPLIGTLDEWHQLYIPGRNASVWDWATDVVGAGVAVYVYYRFVKGKT